MQGDADTVSLLLSRGADVRRRLRGGGTCLHVAVRHNHAACVKALLAHGADADTADADGETCLDLAERLALPDVVALLVRAAVSRNVDNTLAESRSRDEVRSSQHAQLTGFYCVPCGQQRSPVRKQEPCACLKAARGCPGPVESMHARACTDVAPATQA